MIYLNNAATSYPKAPNMASEMAYTISIPPGHGNRAAFGRTKEEKDCRQLLADLLAVSNKRQIVYAPNATYALNLALLGYPWKKGDLVLTTAAEHNSVLRPLYYLRNKGIIDYEILPVDREGRLEENVLSRALQKRKPAMIVFSHASNVTGAINDVRRITRLVKFYGGTILLDASQTVGLYPVYPERWGIDMVAFTGHKYLLGPQGTGGLYVAPHVHLDPVLTGGTGIYSDLEEMPEEMPVRLEAGTQNEHSFYGLSQAICWGKENPPDWKAINEKIVYIENRLRKLGLTVIEVKGYRTPVISFVSNYDDPEDIGDMLSGSYNIICRTGLHCAPHIFPYLGIDQRGTVRISLSRFTSWEETELFIQAMEAITSEQA